MLSRDSSHNRKITTTKNKDSTEGVESEQVTAFKAEYDGRAEKDDN